MKGLIVTATGTDVGKTIITGAIAAALEKRGLRVGVFKPLASGAVRNANGELRSPDANFLMWAAAIDALFYKEVNEICLEPALTPAVAAKISQRAIDMKRVGANLHLHAQKYDYILVEGVGGLISPLWERYTFADFMLNLGFPAILVSKAGLGAINDAVLSDSYAKTRGIRIDGIVFNRWNEEQVGILEQSNASYIRELTGLADLGKFPWIQCDGKTEENRAVLAETAEKYMQIDGILAMMGGGISDANV